MKKRGEGRFFFTPQCVSHLNTHMRKHKRALFLRGGREVEYFGVQVGTGKHAKLRNTSAKNRIEINLPGMYIGPRAEKT